MRGISRRLIAVAAAVLVGATAAPTVAQAHVRSYYKVGYFTQWGIYGRNYQLSKVESSGQAAGLTHLNYAFGNVAADGTCVSADPWADWQTPFSADLSVDGVADVAGQPISGNLNQLAELKAKNPKLKVLISLGGWSGSAYFSDAALTAASRSKLVSSCVGLWLKGDLPGLTAGVAAGIFDGVDLDWEWPGSDGNAGNIQRPQDKRDFTLLAAEFRAQLDALGQTTHKHYDLSAFLPAAPAKLAAGFEANKIFKYLDFGTVQGFDYHGTWETTTNQQSALFVPRNAPTTPDFSGSTSLKAWTDRGGPKKQLVLGIPYYGQGWTGVTNAGKGLFQPAAGAAKGTWADGNEDYKVLATLPQQGYKVYHDLLSGSAWLFNGTTFWTFDDPIVVAQKGLYIRLAGYGGAMIWSLDGDDANGTLTKAIYTTLR